MSRPAQARPQARAAVADRTVATHRRCRAPLGLGLVLAVAWNFRGDRVGLGRQPLAVGRFPASDGWGGALELLWPRRREGIRRNPPRERRQGLPRRQRPRRPAARDGRRRHARPLQPEADRDAGLARRRCGRGRRVRAGCRTERDGRAAQARDRALGFRPSATGDARPVSIAWSTSSRRTSIGISFCGGSPSRARSALWARHRRSCWLSAASRRPTPRRNGSSGKTRPIASSSGSCHPRRSVGRGAVASDARESRRPCDASVRRLHGHRGRP